MPKKTTPENVTVGITPVALKEHEHAHCISDAINTAEAYCKNAKLRFTPIRRKVLEILAQEHRAIARTLYWSDCGKMALALNPPWHTGHLSSLRNTA